MAAPQAAPPEQPSVASARGRAIWHLARLLLTFSAVAAGLFMSSCGLLLAGIELATLPGGPEVRTVPGTVVRMARQETRDVQNLRTIFVYAPVVRFSVDGAEREFTGRLATGRPPWTVGQNVRVRYDPRDPDRPALVGWEVWSVPATWVGIGVPLLVAGLVLWRRRWWTRTGFQ